MKEHRGGNLMDTFVYRIQTDGEHYICEVQTAVADKVVWDRVAFQGGRVHKKDGMEMTLEGEYFSTERELLRVIESVVGTSARRVREWRTV